MLIQFDQLQENIIPQFRGGEGNTVNRMYADPNNKIMRGFLAPGCTIGLHTHDTSSEIIYILSGKGKVLCDGEWLALGFCGDFGQNNYYSYNPAYAGVTEKTPLRSGGQSPIEKELALQDIEAGVKAVEYFIRTGEFYPGIDWGKQL